MINYPIGCSASAITVLDTLWSYCFEVGLGCPTSSVLASRCELPYPTVRACLNFLRRNRIIAYRYGKWFPLLESSFALVRSKDT